MHIYVVISPSPIILGFALFLCPCFIAAHCHKAKFKKEGYLHNLALIFLNFKYSKAVFLFCFQFSLFTLKINGLLNMKINKYNSWWSLLIGFFSICYILPPQPHPILKWISVATTASGCHMTEASQWCKHHSYVFACKYEQVDLSLLPSLSVINIFSDRDITDRGDIYNIFMHTWTRKFFLPPKDITNEGELYSCKH